ncbi:MAG: heme biosynthesis HemY N-terminal domain-containing protein [Halioglobus sp.]
MRRLFAVSLIALLLGVGIVALIETDPGYVLLAYGNYTLESSLWVGLVVLFIGMLLFYWLLRIIYRLLGGQQAFTSWLGRRRSDQAQRNTARGVISYTEGNWRRARRLLLRGARGHEAPLMNYLLAAHASDHLEEAERVEEYLHAAADSDDGAAAAVAISRAEIHLRAGDYAGALAALEPFHQDVARYPQVLNAMQQAYEGLQDWDKLVDLLPQMRKHKLLGESELVQMEHHTHMRRLRAATSAEQLNHAWQALPAGLRDDRELLWLHVARQVELGDHAGAEKSVLRGLKQGWDAQLVRHYGLIAGDNASQQLTQAERWLADHPNDAQLLLCLGRLCLRDKLWGKARDYFERSYQLEPGAEVCAELGRLLLGLGEPRVAVAYYREGLSLLEPGLPDLPQPDALSQGDPSAAGASQGA